MLDGLWMYGDIVESKEQRSRVGNGHVEVNTLRYQLSATRFDVQAPGDRFIPGIVPSFRSRFGVADQRPTYYSS